MSYELRSSTSWSVLDTRVGTGNESVPIQLAQCRFPGQVISNARIEIYFSNKIYGSNYIKQHSGSGMVWNYQTADCRFNKKLNYRRVTARCVLSVVILPIATQQCRNYLYDNSWPNWWYEVGGFVGGNVSWTMCTQSWRDRVGVPLSQTLRCYKQTDDGRIVYITCIPTTCCGEIF